MAKLLSLWAAFLAAVIVPPWFSAGSFAAGASLVAFAIGGVYCAAIIARSALERRRGEIDSSFTMTMSFLWFLSEMLWAGILFRSF